MAEEKDGMLTTEPVEASQEERSSNWSIPFNMSLETLDKIIRGYYNAKADAKPISADKVNEVTGVNADTISRNYKFLSSVGLLSEDASQKGLYSLTPKGKEYAIALGGNKVEVAGQILKEILPFSPLSNLVSYIGVQGPSLTREDLFNHIKTLARIKGDEQHQILTPYRTGINCLISIFNRAGFVSNELVAQAESAKSSSSGARKTGKKSKEIGIPEETSAVTELIRGESSQGQNQRQLSFSLPYNININIEAKDPESIKAVIELIKQLKKSDSTDVLSSP